MPADGQPHAQYDEAIAQILRVVRAVTHVEFSHYRPGMLLRRINNRMLGAGVACLEEYVQLLRTDVDEPWRLLERLTIKVSQFFRGRDVFDHLENDLVRLAQHHQPLRIWCAGCANGEEAYSLAWLLAHTGVSGTVLATDIDPIALRRAASGCYERAAFEHLRPEELDGIFDPAPDAAGRWQVRASLRRLVRFQRHDLLSDNRPSTDRFDLVSCRNVLIYLHPSAQQPVLYRMATALRQDGMLCLGEAEWLSPEIAGLFEAGPRALKLFRRIAGNP